PGRRSRVVGGSRARSGSDRRIARDHRTSSLDHARLPPPAEGGALPRPTPARREQACRGPGAVSEVSEGPSRLPLSQAGLGDGRENVGRVLPKMRRAAPFLLLEILFLVAGQLPAAVPPSPSELLQVSATFRSAAGTSGEVLSIEVRISPGWHVNSHKPS